MIRQRRKNAALFHERVGTILRSMGFKRKGNTYVRLYGDWIFQSISLISGNRVIVEGGSTLFIDMNPLYGSMDILEFPYVKISDLPFFDFGRVVGYDKSYLQQLDIFSREYVRRFDEVKDVKSLLQIKKEWWSDFEDDGDDEPEDDESNLCFDWPDFTRNDSSEEDEFEAYFASKYPEIAENCRCVFFDQGMLYAAIREGLYTDAIMDIKDSYYSGIALDEYRLETGFYTKEVFEQRQDFMAEDRMREMEICGLMEKGDSAGVERCLQKNIERNTELLKKQLKLDVKDFTCMG